ncbi:MAG: DUF2917 domain-containing protein [Burkholderiales bacterium]
MNIDLDQASVKLDQGRTLPLRNARGSIVVVAWGTVWVTQADDRRDHIVGAGETFAIGVRGLTLIHALRDAAITILEPGAGDGIMGAKTNRQRSMLASLNTSASHHGLNSFELEQARRLRAAHVNALLATAGRAVKRGFRSLRQRVSTSMSRWIATSMARTHHPCSNLRG